MKFKNLLSSNVKGTVVFHDENKIVVLDEYSSTHTYENVKPCTLYIGTQVKAGDTLGEFKDGSLHYKVERVGNLTPVDEVKLNELTKKYTNVLEKLAEKHDIPSNDILEVGDFDGSEFRMTVDVIEKSKVFELYNEKAEKVFWLGEDGFLYVKNLKLVKLNKDESTAPNDKDKWSLNEENNCTINKYIDKEIERVLKISNKDGDVCIWIEGGTLYGKDLKLFKREAK